MAFEYPACTYRVSAKGAILMGDKLLLVKEDADYWDLPGGGVEHREELEAAVRREVEEETGLHLTCVDINHMEPWITYDEAASRPLLFLVYPVKTDQTVESGMHGEVEIGLFGSDEIAALALPQHLENFRQRLIELAS